MEGGGDVKGRINRGYSIQRKSSPEYGCDSSSAVLEGGNDCTLLQLPAVCSDHLANQ